MKAATAWSEHTDPAIIAAIDDWLATVASPDVPISHIRHALRLVGLSHDVERTVVRLQRLVDAGVLDWSPRQDGDRRYDVRRLGAVGK